MSRTGTSHAGTPVQHLESIAKAAGTVLGPVIGAEHYYIAALRSPRTSPAVHELGSLFHPGGEDASLLIRLRL